MGQAASAVLSNGAGKSTLIKTLLGFLAPSEGGCEVLGDDPELAATALRQAEDHVDRLSGYYLPLLQAREQLSNLVTYMDGKSGAEDLISKVLSDPTLLQSLASAPKKGQDEADESKPAEG